MTEEERRAFEAMTAAYRAQEAARRLPMTEAAELGPDEYSHLDQAQAPVSPYEAQFRPKLSTEQGQGPYPPLQAGPWLDARTAPQVPAGYTYGDDQVTRDPNNIPATVEYPSPAAIGWDALTGLVPGVGSAVIGGIKGAGTAGKYGEKILDMVRDYRDSVGRHVRQMQEPPDQSVPELRNSHGGSLVSGAIEGLRDMYTHPGKVWRGEADPYDPAQAFNFATTMMTGGVGGVPAKAGEMALGSGPIKPIRAYHGSPHDFDRFDLSKIGTGEGAQAYGHGLYMAENEGTARSYRDALSGWKVGGEKYDVRNPEHLGAVALQERLNEGVPLDQARYMARHSANMLFKEGPERNRALAIINGKEPMPEVNKTGRMYEVAIHADPKRFLDWDKPLSGQHPDVQSTVAERARRVGDPTMKAAPLRNAADALQRGDYGAIPGDTAYQLMATDKNPATAAQALREAGIPGIKYLDAGSRAANEGSRNYVLFDDKIIEILKKYGVASIAALPPAVQAAIQAGQPREKADF